MPSSHSPAGLVVALDDDHAVANAGLLLPATLAERLGIETVADEQVILGDRPGHHRPGRKLLTLLHALVAGGDCIDDADLLRTGSTAEVLGHRVMAPRRWGRSYGRSPSATSASWTASPKPSWAGRGPPVPAGDGPVTIDLDSTSCEAHGHHKAAPPTATPASSATTPCWPPGPTPARSCMPASAPAGPPPAAAPNGWSTSSPDGCAGPAPAAS